MVNTKFLPVLLGLSGIVMVGGCQNKTTTEDPKTALAFYSYAAGPYAETVTLWASGKYLQTYTTQPHQPYLPDRQIIYIPLPQKEITVKQTGTWQMLDRPGGKPLPLPASASALPSTAVVEIKHALPFGLVFENQPTYATNRTIMVSEFHIKKPGQPLQVQ